MPSTLAAAHPLLQGNYRFVNIDLSKLRTVITAGHGRVAGIRRERVAGAEGIVPGTAAPAENDPVLRVPVPSPAEVTPGRRRRRAETMQQPGEQRVPNRGTDHACLLLVTGRRADDAFGPHEGEVPGAEAQLAEHRLGVLPESGNR